MGAGASSAYTVVAGAKPSLRPSAVVGGLSSTVAIHTYSSSGAIQVGKAPGESVFWSAHGHLRQECCAAGGGDQATDQAPETCRPNAAQSVVLGGLRPHTCETSSLAPKGGGGTCRKWSRRSASPPDPSPWGVPLACRAGVETKRRAFAMILSRTGRDRDPPLGRSQTREGRRAPWVVRRVRPTRGPHLLLLLLQVVP